MVLDSYVKCENFAIFTWPCLCFFLYGVSTVHNRVETLSMIDQKMSFYTTGDETLWYMEDYITRLFLCYSGDTERTVVIYWT